MKAIDLYKYIENEQIEWHYCDNNGTPDVLIFPRYYNLPSFHRLLTPEIFDGLGLWAVMKDGYVAIWMNQVCEHYDIELAEVFPPGDDE